MHATRLALLLLSVILAACGGGANGAQPGKRYIKPARPVPDTPVAYVNGKKIDLVSSSVAYDRAEQTLTLTLASTEPGNTAKAHVAMKLKDPAGQVASANLDWVEVRFEGMGTGADYKVRDETTKPAVQSLSGGTTTGSAVTVEVAWMGRGADGTEFELLARTSATLP